MTRTVHRKPPPQIAVHLPTELLILVASYLRNSSKKSKGLLKFSLVCRSWRDIARPFVFDAITLRNAAQELELANFLVVHPDAGRWVRSLSYLGDGRKALLPSDCDPWLDWFKDNRPGLSGMLPNLVSLTFGRFWGGVESSHATLLQEFGRTFGPVKKLTITECLCRAGDLVSLVSNFRDLRTLSLDRLSIFSVIRDPQLPCDLPHLTTLVVQSPGFEANKFISRLRSLRSIRNLTLDWGLMLETSSLAQAYVQMLSTETARIDTLTFSFSRAFLCLDPNADIRVAGESSTLR